MTRILGSAAVVLGLALALAGCGIPLTSDDLPPRRPDATIGVDEPTASNEPTEINSDLIPEDELTCEPLPADLLPYIEGIGNVGGAIRYTTGQMVAYGDGWWAVAVKTKVEPNASGYSSENVPSVAYFNTTAPGIAGDEKAQGVAASGGSAQHRLASSCLS